MLMFKNLPVFEFCKTGCHRKRTLEEAAIEIGADGDWESSTLDIQFGAPRPPVEIAEILRLNLKSR
jgi:hypothetical protein